MREYASVYAKGGLVSVTLGSDSGGRDSELSRHFAEVYHNSLYKVYGQNMRENSGVDVEKSLRAQRMQRFAADIEETKRLAVRIMAQIEADRYGIPQCRIFVQKVPKDASVQTCNCALQTAKDFYLYAVLSREFMYSYGDSVKKLLSTRMAITLDTSALQ